MNLVRLAMLALCFFIMVACSGENPAPQEPAPVSQPTAAADQPAVPNPVALPADQSAGGVSVRILPENPTAKDCLRAAIQGVPGRSAVIWTINGEIVSTKSDNELCNGGYHRGDRVTVEVGTRDQGARSSVLIANSPPRVIDISSTPAEIFAGTDISVIPVAEDADGDSVDFTYQWLVNGGADPLLTRATLPGNRFTKGDTVQVLIVPNDFYDDGPTYESFAQPIPNAAPRITSQPPQGITSLDYRYQVEVSDPDDSQFSFRFAEAPEGMTIDASSGLIEWSLVEAKPGTHTIAIIVSDPDGAEAAQEFTLTLAASE